MTDQEGLDRAYASDTNIYVDNNSGKMYIAGTKSWQDAMTDVTIMFPGLITKTPRFKQAEKVLRENPAVSQIIAHSLGSEIAHQLVKKYRYTSGVLYAHPTVSFYNNPRLVSHRHFGDPISMGDFAASSTFSWNPHSYN